jgi:bifunctional non-homologous end joining protein LigD
MAYSKLVGEVKFTEWTRDSEMRDPVFLGLRTDKKALDVVREQNMKTRVIGTP